MTIAAAERTTVGAFPWLTPRCCVAILALAALVCCAAFVPAFAYAAVVATCALAGFFAADIAIGPRRDDVTVTREPLGHLALRRPATLRYVVENRGRAAVYFGIIDTPVPELQFLDGQVSGWLPPSRRTVESMEVLPVERGLAELGTLYVRGENNIGLLRRRWAFPGACRTRVFPDLSAVERYGRLARHGRLMEAGFRKLRLRGGGGEFESLREWTPDDSFRSIDWKATARRVKLMVASYDVERSQNVMLVLDAGRLMMPRIGSQRKFDYALTAALSVATLAAGTDDRVGLTAFASAIVEHVAPRSGAGHASALVRRLYDLQPRFEEADYAGAFTFLQRVQRKRSLVVFFTDMFDPIASSTVLANAGLLAKRHLVMCVLLNDEAIDAALDQTPQSPRQAYRAGVAAALATERSRAAAVLAQRGIMVLDVPASRLTVSLINSYVDVKSRGLL
ncbi:MAG: DUF58 domain-containing protein [Candidatus Eremiobacteraeota bacterium]|nr:DUF58 domain-containing protein [Candidatus Eremiobacteraeota bacterium]MBC5827085.1 DUF58 domain-containing protein [Candidatus Eremiobacteraeota bacterium]